MTINKIVRSICCFTKNPSDKSIEKITNIEKVLLENGFSIQTKRLCSPSIEKIIEMDKRYAKVGYILGIGSISHNILNQHLKSLLNCVETHWNLDLTDKEITLDDVQILFEIIREKPEKTFNFTYVFHNSLSTPFFPSATYGKDGFSLGLQPTDLSSNCNSLDERIENMKSVWDELFNLFSGNGDFLGIDSSIAPLVTESGSFIGFIKRLGIDFSQSVTTDFYIRITNFLKNNNPKPIGLCGLMFPCLEDSELASEYEKGNFTIERNIYLSLHSGLGVDTYPIGIDEKPERILNILKLLQALSDKYKKPLSCRFVSDGKTKIGNKSDFNNQYLKDVVIRNL